MRAVRYPARPANATAGASPSEQTEQPGDLSVPNCARPPSSRHGSGQRLCVGSRLPFAWRGTIACTSGSGTSKTCFEIYASNTTAAGTASAKADCTNRGGVASDMCSHAGADGACKVDASQSGVTASFTTWYYAGNAASEMQACTAGGNNWVAP
ncbi:MAG: hypothetical protein ABJA82_19075 [Myxococcales bacterium]